jgi:hypothetical protein
MIEREEYEWYVELDYMRAQLRYALHYLDNPSKNQDMKGKISRVCHRLAELCEQTEGESK